MSNKNLYAYCDNNPIKRSDETGNIWYDVGIILTGGIVGGIMGGLSAITTGGNVLGSVLEGTMTGVISSSMGTLVGGVTAVIIAGLSAGIVDVGVQVTTHYFEQGNLSNLQIDIVNSFDVALQTAIGTAIPSFNRGGSNLNNAIATALMWGGVSVMMTSADIIATNTWGKKTTKAKETASALRRIQSKSDTLRQHGGYVVFG